MPPNVPQFSSPNLGALVSAPNPLMQLLQSASQLPQLIQQAKANQMQNQLAQQLIQQNNMSLDVQHQQSQQQQQQYASTRAGQLGASIVNNNGIATPIQKQQLQQLAQLTGDNYFGADGSVNVDFFKKDFHDLTTDDLNSLRALSPYDRALALKNYKNVDPKFLKERQELDMKTMASIGEINARAGKETAQAKFIGGPMTALENARTKSTLANIQIGWAKVHNEMQRTAIMAQRAAQLAMRARSGDRMAVGMARSAFMQGLTQLNSAERLYYGSLDALGKLKGSAGNRSLSDLAQDPTFGPKVQALMTSTYEARQQLNDAQDQMRQAGTLLSTGGDINSVVQQLSGRTVKMSQGEKTVQEELPP